MFRIFASYSSVSVRVNGESGVSGWINSSRVGNFSTSVVAGISDVSSAKVDGAAATGKRPSPSPSPTLAASSCESLPTSRRAVSRASLFRSKSSLMFCWLGVSQPRMIDPVQQYTSKICCSEAISSSFAAIRDSAARKASPRSTRSLSKAVRWARRSSSTSSPT